MFLVPPRSGTITQIQGIESLEADKHVVRYKLENCAGKYIAPPIDNACYLGHVIARDTEGINARAYAEEALNRIILCFDDKG